MYNQDSFANIPPEIITDILSRLPVRTIISCKRVCKSWLAFLETHTFAKLHLLKAIPSLSVYTHNSNFYEIFQFEDGLDPGRHYKSVTKFSFPFKAERIVGSANGLLCLTGWYSNLVLYICNPTTRDYIELECPCPQDYIYTRLSVVTYGFGASRITGQLKVISILQDYNSLNPETATPECVCQAYTIGTGLWRRVSPVVHLVYPGNSPGRFLNGNLHWLVFDFKGPRRWISCVDLVTEQFITFSSPFLKKTPLNGPYILGGCLCLLSYGIDDGTDIWLMKEYGVETSWTKQFFIVNAHPYKCGICINPIKVFKDGDILIAKSLGFLLYSKKNKTLHKVGSFENRYYFDSFFYTPSFLSLESFGTENVSTF